MLQQESQGPVMRIEGVTIAPPGGAAVLNDVDLSLRAGEVLCLLGASGAGKSLLARAVLRFGPEAGGPELATGRILLDDRDIATCDGAGLRALRGGEVGMIFQEAAAALTPGRRIGAQLIETLRLRPGTGRAAARAEARDWLRRVGLGAEVARAYPHQLSGGMAQRAMIALALARRPKLLIADEATTALDPVTQAEILALLGGLCREEGLAVLLITHDAGVARVLADRVARMKAGVSWRKARRPRCWSHNPLARGRV
ncbi:ATP-binding cassette domain-containing protein [Roseovarius sp. C7]|uniref:ATP-binding cassette domain-containing protein n=1 Tax=Roseovarius sp. C7 TaxID=3398643 RepID=UPI0039F6745F